MFIELWNKRQAFAINNPLKNYLKNRLWFKLSGYFRTKGFKEKHFKNFETFLQQEQNTAVYLDEMEIREMDLQYEAVMEVINRTIAEMPEKMRAVFLMSRSNEYSITEIAEKLQISPKTVKNQINIALNRIRQATANPSLTAMEILFLIWLTN
jgi:RNA polymerase sigma factor (sigma-70 family)